MPTDGTETDIDNMLDLLRDMKTDRKELKRIIVNNEWKHALNQVAWMKATLDGLKSMIKDAELRE